MATKKMPASKNEIKNKYKMESISTPFINPIVHEGSGAALKHAGRVNVSLNIPNWIGNNNLLPLWTFLWKPQNKVDPFTVSCIAIID